ncbi:MAG: hypothetical protein JW863_10875 [Chitinispirillaceae bacterium]|nr:hypothetical protein [Chitinispirillaceae bacterium]
MRQLLGVMVSAILFFACTPKEVYRVQTFTPFRIDMAKIEEKNYQELVDAVNINYAPETKEFVDARFLREQDMFLYFHVYSSRDNGCYRVTIDKNRSKVVNIQPDCPVEED